MYDNEIPSFNEDIEAPQPQPSAKEEKQKNWSDREWFIMDMENDNCLGNRNFLSEKDCREFIRSNGEYDHEYIIGYRVYALKPIIKRAKIVLN